MKKFTSSLLLFLFIKCAIAQPDYWTSKATLTGHARMAGAAFSIGNKGFVGIGTDFNATVSQLKDFWEYDPVSDSYTQIADYPGGGVNGAGTFSIEDKGYVCGGAGNGNFYNDLWAYDTLLNTWTQKAPLTGSVRDYTVGFAIGVKGYIATGYSGSQDLNDLWEYDPVADSWTSRASVSSQTRSSAAGFSIGSKGYLGTGYIGGGTVDFWEYDPSSNAWTQKADVSTIPRSDGVGFSIGGYGYICCGYGVNMPDNDLWEYDPSLNIWAQRAALNGLGRANPIAFSIGLKGYVFGGSDPGFNAIADMHEYTPDTTLINSTSLINETDFSIYPNPTNGKLFVSAYSQDGTVIEISIYNITSRKVLAAKMPTTYCLRPFELDISSLTPGIYTCVLSGDKKISKKIVIE